MLIEKEFNNFYSLKWLEQYIDGHKGFIAGGCFKNIFNNEKVKDIDIFFKNQNEWKSAVAYYDKLCGEKNDGDVYRFYYENKKVKAYKNIITGIVIELCCNAFGSPEEILNMFDFTITKFAYAKREVEDTEVFGTTYIESYIVCDDKYFEHLHLKRIVVDNQLLYPISTFDRLLRYAKYGYFPCKETKMKIIDAIRKVNTVEGLSESLYDGMD
jgi:hypothetical protein